MKQLGGWITVGNERGVHSRIATGLAEIAAKYQVRLHLSLKEETADCSMILDVLALGCVQGDQLQVMVEGDAAPRALESVEALLTAKEDPK